MTSKAIRNYRIAEQRRKAREREEQERILAENEDLSADNQKLRRRAHRMEEEYHRILTSAHVLEEKETGRIFAGLIADMLADPRFRGRMQPLIDQIEERLMIRIDTHRYGPGVELRLDNRDDPEKGAQVAFSVRIPEMNITIWEDARKLEMATGKRGPVVMDDRPIMVVEEPRPFASYSNPNTNIQNIMVKTV